MTTPVNDTLAEDRHTIARRLKGCAQRRELPTWGEIEFAADAILDLLARNSPDCAAQTSLADEEAQIVKAAAERVARRSGGSPDSGEVDRLRERCDGYKGQVEAGSIAIQHLQGEIERLRGDLATIRDCFWTDGENYAERLADLKTIARTALSSG